MFEDDVSEVRSQGGPAIDFEEVDHVLQDFGEQPAGEKGASWDALMFIVDCSPAIMVPLLGDHKSQFEFIMDGLANTLKNKIISSPNDRVGLLLYNTQRGENELKFKHMCTALKLEHISAQAIRAASQLAGQFGEQFGAGEGQPACFHEVLWLYNQEAKGLDRDKYHQRVFLFTCEEEPLFRTEADRDMALNHARKLVEQNVQLELFPLKKTRTSKFNMRRFYHEVVALDPEEINAATLDSTSKIMELQQRLRQKENKKRTLSRLLFDVAPDTRVGVKMSGSDQLLHLQQGQEADRPQAGRTQQHSAQAAHQVPLQGDRRRTLPQRD
jgi:ATP-dependent DNA helicase 2 subunit 1